MNDRFESVLFCDFALDTELGHVSAFALKSRLDLVDVEASLFVNLSGVWFQKNVCLCILKQKVSEFASSLKIVFIKKSGGELGEVIAVNVLLGKDDW